jgi:hypothetical protein
VLVGELLESSAEWAMEAPYDSGDLASLFDQFQ